MVNYKKPKMDYLVLDMEDVITSSNILIDVEEEVEEDSGNLNDLWDTGSW